MKFHTTKDEHLAKFDKEAREIEIRKRRSAAVYDEIEAAGFPEGITCCFVGDGVAGWISIHLAVEKTTEKEAVLKAIAVATRMCGPMERKFDEGQGTFFWSTKWGDDSPWSNRKDADGTYRVDCAIGNANAASPQCTIRKVTKTVEVFEADCGEGNGKEVTQ